MIIKRLVIFIMILFSIIHFSYAENDSMWNLYTKYVSSIKAKDIKPSLLKFNSQLQKWLQLKRNEKLITLYKLNNAKLKATYLKSSIESDIIKNWFILYIVDGKNKLLVDDWSIFKWYYWDKYVIPGKWYVIKENDFLNTIKGNKSTHLKYAIYNKNTKNIYVSDTISTKMIANLNELNSIFWWTNQLTSSIKWDMSFYFLWNSNWTSYLYKILKSISLTNNTFTFYDNKIDIHSEDIKIFSLINNKVNGTYFIWKTEQNNIWETSIYKNIWNENQILYIIASNLYWWKSFDLNTFIQIKNTTDNLTKNLTSKEDKIKAIYEYIIQNTEYDNETLERDKSLNDMSKVSSVEPYSWFWAFKNKKAVCNGYVELMYFMVSFAGINDVEKIDGRVTTYQAIWQNHTWLRVWDKYYDPTFDDGTSSRKYYGISKDVMLWDRIVWFTWNPIALDKVFSNYVKLSSKYNEELVKWYKVLSDLWITQKSDLNTENLKQKLWYMNNSEITSGSRIYVLDTPTSDYYLMLVMQLWADFWKWKIWTTDSWKVSFIVKI